jgi:TonB family protein
VAFVVTVAEPAAAVPRPWLPADWRYQVTYTGGVGLLLLALIAIVRMVPDDPRALSLDDVGLSRRMAKLTMIPAQVMQPEIDRAADWLNTTGGSGSPAAAKESGQAGDKKAPRADAKRAVKGPTAPRDASQVAAEIRANSLLAVLDNQHATATSKVFAPGEVIGGSLTEAMGHLDSTIIADAYGHGGIGLVGTGAGGGGTHEGTLGGGGLGTLGKFGVGPGTGPGYGAGQGALHRREVAKVPSILVGDSIVRGSLDKEIIRRIVRRHLNEVKYCYEQELPRNAKLAGRVVVQFTIANTGRVLASVLQSSTMGNVRVESCVVNAVRRWEFPEPSGGGLVMVSYPFQLSPAGG